MKELLAAAAEARVTDLTYEQRIDVWSDYSRYNVFIPFGHRYVSSGQEIRAARADMQRVFGGIFFAMADAELSSPGSLLTQAIDKAGTNTFGKSMALINSEYETGNKLLRVNLTPLCKILAHIANNIQQGIGGSDREKAFWNAHLGAVKNKITWYDTFNYCPRSEREYCNRDLWVARTSHKWHEYVEAEKPVPTPAPSPDVVDELKAALSLTTAALVQNVYDDELTRLRTGGATPTSVTEIDPQSELSKQFAAARDKAQKDFLAEQPVPEIVEPEVVEVVAAVVEPPAPPRLPPLVISGEPELPRPAPV